LVSFVRKISTQLEHECSKYRRYNCECQHDSYQEAAYFYAYDNFIVSSSLTANSVGAPLLILSAGLTVDGTFPVFYIFQSLFHPKKSQ
jgi:hypothetical protein